MSRALFHSSFFYRLSSFAAEWKKAQIEKDAQRRQELESHRSLLIVKGSLSPELIAVLLEIFSRYAANGGILDIATIQLTKIEASRLWYRCGMKLSSLNDILERKLQGGEKMLVFQDFCSLLQRIVDDDEERLSKMALNSVDGSDFEVRTPTFFKFYISVLLYEVTNLFSVERLARRWNLLKGTNDLAMQQVALFCRAIVEQSLRCKMGRQVKGTAFISQGDSSAPLLFVYLILSAPTNQKFNPSHP